MIKKITDIMLILLGAVLAFQAAGCAPAIISSATRQQVAPRIDYKLLWQDPEAYLGKTVLLAGDIIETKNTADKTAIMVLARSADTLDRPLSLDTALGRFILIQPGFLDPAIYRPGRQITAAGVVVGRDLRPLDEINYSYPLIENRELYLWPEEAYYRREPAVHFGLGIGIGL